MQIFDNDDDPKERKCQAASMEYLQVYNLTAYIVCKKKETQNILQIIRILGAKHIQFNFKCHKELVLQHTIKIFEKMYVRQYCKVVNSRNNNNNNHFLVE